MKIDYAVTSLLITAMSLRYPGRCLFHPILDQTELAQARLDAVQFEFAPVQLDMNIYLNQIPALYTCEFKQNMVNSFRCHLRTGLKTNQWCNCVRCSWIKSVFICQYGPYLYPIGRAKADLFQQFIFIDDMTMIKEHVTGYLSSYVFVDGRGYYCAGWDDFTKQLANHTEFDLIQLQDLLAFIRGDRTDDGLDDLLISDSIKPLMKSFQKHASELTFEYNFTDRDQVGDGNSDESKLISTAARITNFRHTNFAIWNYIRIECIPVIKHDHNLVSIIREHKLKPVPVLMDNLERSIFKHGNYTLQRIYAYLGGTRMNHIEVPEKWRLYGKPEYHHDSLRYDNTLSYWPLQYAIDWCIAGYNIKYDADGTYQYYTTSVDCLNHVHSSESCEARINTVRDMPGVGIKYDTGATSSILAQAFPCLRSSSVMSLYENQLRCLLQSLPTRPCRFKLIPDAIGTDSIRLEFKIVSVKGVVDGVVIGEIIENTNNPAYMVLNEMETILGWVRTRECARLLALNKTEVYRIVLQELPTRLHYRINLNQPDDKKRMYSYYNYLDLYLCNNNRDYMELIDIGLYMLKTGAIVMDTISANLYLLYLLKYRTRLRFQHITYHRRQSKIFENWLGLELRPGVGKQRC